MCPTLDLVEYAVPIVFNVEADSRAQAVAQVNLLLHGVHLGDWRARMMVHHPVLTVADFKVGDQVTVIADQGYRLGQVIKLGRIRLTVTHPRNKSGAMVTRAYGMFAVVVGQTRRSPTSDWHLVLANGTRIRRVATVREPGGWRVSATPLPDIPVVAWNDSETPPGR